MITTIIVGLVMFGIGFYFGDLHASLYTASLLIVNGFKNYKGHLFPHKYSEKMITKAKKIVPDIQTPYQ